MVYTMFLSRSQKYFSISPSELNLKGFQRKYLVIPPLLVLSVSDTSMLNKTFDEMGAPES